jgi:aminoglycoside 3-N-acetyltransferase
VAEHQVALERERLVADLAALGLRPGRDVLVHSALRQIGPPTPAAATVLGALLDVLGPRSTVVVPTHTSDNSITSEAFRRAADRLTPAGAEAAIMGFDEATSPSYGMSALSEYVRQLPGAVRSTHPQASFAALGPEARRIVAVHDLDCHLGEHSPLGALYLARADIVLIGVGYEACTALHLAEYRLPEPRPERDYRCFTLHHGQRVQHDFRALALDASDFRELGQALDQATFVKSGRVGNARARTMPMRDAVDAAVDWMMVHR